MTRKHTTASSRPSSRRRNPRPYRPRELRDAQLTPAKALGQHFLTDYAYVNRIVVAAELTPGIPAIEVGAGTGVLTQRLAAVAGHVIALELDAELAERLRTEFAGTQNLTVVQGDAVQAQPSELLQAAGLPPDTPYVMAGNLPYNAGAAIVRHFLEEEHPPMRMIVMLQREVAESMAASQGELGLLGVSVQVYARVRKLFNIPPRAFYPPPKITSSVLRLDVRPEPLVSVQDRGRFFRVVRAGFSAPRKRLRNSLAQGLGAAPNDIAAAIEAEGIGPGLRPGQLALEDWLRLTSRLGGDA